MELAKIETTIPIKAIPEADLNTRLVNVFMPWLSGLLSLAGESSAEKLKNAFPAIKTQCWSMGFLEIKKMFEMYADGKLSIKPRSNYFDRILLGQIVEAYKKELQTKPERVNEKEEKELQDYKHCIEFFDMYFQDRKLPYESVWLYYYLTDFKKVIEFTKEEKKEALKKVSIKNTEDVNEWAKIGLVESYFEGLINSNKHIKKLI